MTSPQEIDKIEQLATTMRAALEQVPPELCIGLSQFPRGACGDATLLMGAWLADHGIVGFEYICGERGSQEDGTWTSHAFLHRDGLIVDLTADQFEDAPSAVIVAEDSSWHRTFQWDRPSPSDFRQWSGPSIHDLHRAYGAAKTAMAESNRAATENAER